MLNQVTVQTDLGVNAHDHLDYQLEYKPYLQYMREMFNGYMSQQHFVAIFAKQMSLTEHKVKYILKKLVQEKWVESISLSSKYKFLYLKRKAMICITGKKAQTDLKPPTMRQIVRSLLLAEYLLQLKHYSGIVQLYNDVFSFSFDESVLCLVMDITKRSVEEYKALIERLVTDDTFKGRKMTIRFLSYSPDRTEVLRKKLKTNAIQNLKVIHQNLSIALKALDLLPFFDHKEPFIQA